MELNLNTVFLVKEITVFLEQFSNQSGRIQFCANFRKVYIFIFCMKEITIGNEMVPHEISSPSSYIENIKCFAAIFNMIRPYSKPFFKKQFFVCEHVEIKF